MSSKRDYEAMAVLLRAQQMRAEALMQYSGAEANAVMVTVRAVANGYAGIAERDNPRFDRARFLAACGVQPEWRYEVSP